jgi:hypothetical protein
MKPNMKDVIKHLAHGKDLVTAWNKALQDGVERDQEELHRQNLRRQQVAKARGILAAIPIGTKVRMVNCLEAENPKNQHVWITRSEPWQLGHGAWVVSLEGKAGGFDVTKLELAEE